MDAGPYRVEEDVSALLQPPALGQGAGFDLPPDGFTHLPPSISTEVNKIVYKSARFLQAKEITGPIELHLQPLRLLPDGTRMPLLRYGALRASHPLNEEASKIGRPVHDNTVSILVTPGEIREYVIEMNPTSMLIPAGHCLELEITSQCPNACHTEFWTGKVGNMNVVPSNTTTSYKIYRDNNHPPICCCPSFPIRIRSSGYSPSRTAMRLR